MFASTAAFDAALAECTEAQKKVVAPLIFEEKDFLGRKVRSFGYCDGDAGDWDREKVENVAIELEKEDENEELDRDSLIDFAFTEFQNLVIKKAKEMNEGSLITRQDF
jgi:hypothetical protein